MAQKDLMTSDLKKRGWTLGLIKRFLPTPDKTAKNPVFRSKSPMKLYSLARVVRIERTKKFQSEKEKTPKRKQSAKKAVVTKRAKLEAFIDNLVIELPVLSKDELRTKAIEEYNNHQVDRSRFDSDGYPIDWPPANIKSDPQFLDRISVNYLRHCCTKYRDHLKEIAGKTGVEDAYFKLKKKVLRCIAEKYPDLMRECLKQEQKTDDAAFYQAPTY